MAAVGAAPGRRALGAARTRVEAPGVGSGRGFFEASGEVHDFLRNRLSHPAGTSAAKRAATPRRYG